MPNPADWILIDTVSAGGTTKGAVGPCSGRSCLRLVGSFGVLDESTGEVFEPSPVEVSTEAADKIANEVGPFVLELGGTGKVDFATWDRNKDREQRQKVNEASWERSIELANWLAGSLRESFERRIRRAEKRIAEYEHAAVSRVVVPIFHESGEVLGHMTVSNRLRHDPLFSFFPAFAPINFPSTPISTAPAELKRSLRLLAQLYGKPSEEAIREERLRKLIASEEVANIYPRGIVHLRDERFVRTNETLTVAIDERYERYVRLTPQTAYQDVLHVDEIPSGMPAPPAAVKREPLRHVFESVASRTTVDSTLEEQMIADLSWAIGVRAAGGFDKYSGRYIGVIGKKCISSGVDPSIVRSSAAEKCKVPIERVAVLCVEPKAEI